MDSSLGSVGVVIRHSDPRTQKANRLLGSTLKSNGTVSHTDRLLEDWTRLLFVGDSKAPMYGLNLRD